MNQYEICTNNVLLRLHEISGIYKIVSWSLCMWDKRVVELIAKCESTSDQQDTIWSFVANGIFYGKYLISKPVVAF